MVRTPSIVRRWTNLADRRDAVAADLSLAGDYEANDRGVKVQDDLVLNRYVGCVGKANAHKSYGYLATLFSLLGSGRRPDPLGGS